jgi:site-specific DNA-methyltransferase (adenine-specific)
MRKKLYHGNCLEILDTLPPEKIDTCITDPPYELGFMGKDWDSAGVSFQKETWEKVYRVLKPGAFLLAFGGTRTWHRIAVAIEDAGFEIRDTICWLYGQGFPKSYSIGKGIDKKAGKEREIIGKNPNYRNGRISDTTYVRGNKSVENPNLTAPATPEAELWEGRGTALKPAFEPIIVAMKPIDGTFVNNALTHGVAGMWIDGGRIGTEQTVTTIKDLSQAHGNQFGKAGIEYPKIGEKINPPGRWPSNVILDETSAEMLDKQTGIQKGGFVRNRTDGARPFENQGKDTGYETVAEISEPDGGASRFFYCAKANKKERNLGLNGNERNTHATVKPLALMKYLARITKTPTRGIVIDPFMGSGTTGMACALEDRDFIGIELEEESYIIARKRIEYAQENIDELLSQHS